MENLTMKEIKEKEYEELVNEVDALVENDEELPPANIIVAGITGVGKSTLINAVFGKELATTGIGKPQTSEEAAYEDKEVPIRIWDTVGFELSPEKTKATIANIKKIIAEKDESQDSFDRIHAIWYCINAESKRFQAVEADFVIELYKLGVPFIVVMTQCFAKKANNEFESAIRKILAEKLSADIPILQVLAVEKEIEFGDEIKVIPQKGLKELVNITVDNMPDYLKGGFIAAQKIDKDIKRKAAIDVISDYVSMAKNGFWDKVPLIKIAPTNGKVKQMFKRITRLYNQNIPDDELDKLVDAIRKSLLSWNGKIWTLFNPFQGRLSKELDNLINKMDLDTNLNEEEYKLREKSSLFIAVCGITTLDVIEEEWNKSTEEELQNIDVVAKKLQEKFSSMWKGSN